MVNTTLDGRETRDRKVSITRTEADRRAADNAYGSGVIRPARQRRSITPEIPNKATPARPM